MVVSRVLVIETDPAIVDVFAAALHDEGVHVDCATSPDEALDLLSTQDAFSVIVTRPFPIDDDPYSWLDQLREKTHAAIVICSEPYLYADYEKRGYAGLVELPCDLEDLAAVVTSVAATRR